MDRKYKYYASPDKNILTCYVWLNGKLKGSFTRYRDGYIVDSSHDMDIVTHDLELHSFMRLSLKWVTDPEVLSVEDLFELDNLNI